MSRLTQNFWPTARQFAEAVQCPGISFADPYLKNTEPAIDRLGMPLVTSGQFAYVFKLKAINSPEAVAVRCFRGYLGDREQRYRALDEHLNAHRIAALPRFEYDPQGILVSGARYPVLVMEWIEGTTLDVYLEETFERREVLLHLADEWLRLMSNLREAGVAHGDLQHGNIIVEHGQLRLVDLDGIFVPGMEGWSASEIGHQHYQHPARDERFFNAALDNFSALVVYLSLISLAERPTLWGEHHDENLLFTKSDFITPADSALFSKIKDISPEHQRLAEALEQAANDAPAATPSLSELVSLSGVSKLPSWMTAPPGVEVSGRTREVARTQIHPSVLKSDGRWATRQRHAVPHTPGSLSVQSIFSAATPAITASTQSVAPAGQFNLSTSTLFYATRFARHSLVIFWWLPVHNIIMTSVWMDFGIAGQVASVFLTATLFSLIFLICGFLRALYEASSVAVAPPPQTGGLPPASRGFQPPGAAAHGVNSANPRSLAAHASQRVTAQAHVPVVGNQRLLIYHRPGCSWATKILPRHRQQFPTPVAAHAAGYRACKVCAP